MSTTITTPTLPTIDFVEGIKIGDEILLAAVAGQKIAKVKAPGATPGTNRAFSAVGNVD